MRDPQQRRRRQRRHRAGAVQPAARASWELRSVGSHSQANTSTASSSPCSRHPPPRVLLIPHSASATAIARAPSRRAPAPSRAGQKNSSAIRVVAGTSSISTDRRAHCELPVYGQIQLPSCPRPPLTASRERTPVPRCDQVDRHADGEQAELEREQRDDHDHGDTRRARAPRSPGQARRADRAQRQHSSAGGREAGHGDRHSRRRVVQQVHVGERRHRGDPRRRSSSRTHSGASRGPARAPPTATGAGRVSVQALI